MLENASLVEPLLPPEDQGKLSDLVIALVAKASSFAGMLNPIVRQSVGNLVLSMNCYYSNLIEGHDTTPREIDRALSAHFSSEPKKRMLQKEALAHIAVQKKIDAGQTPGDYPISSTYGQWIHSQFCNLLPQELLVIENPDTSEKCQIIPGEHRTETVYAGRHIPPRPENLQHFLHHFDQAYAEHRLSTIQRIISVAASHHRYLWIHPFFDGNGRVVRLMSYAALKKASIGSELWSVARGLARQKDQYREL